MLELLFLGGFWKGFIVNILRVGFVIVDGLFGCLVGFLIIVILDNSVILIFFIVYL